MANTVRRTKTSVTTMRLAEDVLKAAAKRAKQQGVTRTFLVEQCLRKELGMGAARRGVKRDLETTAEGDAGVFD